MKEMTKEFKDKLNSIPSLPGIYMMLDSQGSILYVGKSKCLKTRVKSYFNKVHKWDKINKMVSLISDVEYTVTDTHLEARLLECTRIKALRPPFNSQMNHDRRYVYFQIKDYNPYNALAVVQERVENTYGPFRSQRILTTLISLLRNLYPLSYNGSSYTFEYHLFPVSMDKDTFEENRKTLMKIFSDKDNMLLFLSQLEIKMKELAANYQYELASLLRDIIQSLEYVKHGIDGYQDLFTKRLVLKIPIVDGIKLFYVKEGNILLTKKYKRFSQKYLDNFIVKGNALKGDYNPLVDDKAAIDFRDILYSEVSDFSKDMVIDASIHSV